MKPLRTVTKIKKMNFPVVGLLFIMFISLEALPFLNATSPNVAGVIGSLVAASILMSFLIVL